MRLAHYYTLNTYWVSLTVCTDRNKCNTRWGEDEGRFQQVSKVQENDSTNPSWTLFMWIFKSTLLFVEKSHWSQKRRKCSISLQSNFPKSLQISFSAYLLYSPNSQVNLPMMSSYSCSKCVRKITFCAFMLDVRMLAYIVLIQYVTSNSCFVVTLSTFLLRNLSLVPVFQEKQNLFQWSLVFCLWVHVLSTHCWERDLNSSFCKRIKLLNLKWYFLGDFSILIWYFCRFNFLLGWDKLFRYFYWGSGNDNPKNAPTGFRVSEMVLLVTK